MAILIPRLVGLAQQAVDTLVPEEVTNYGKGKEAILQILNLSTEACNVDYGKLRWAGLPSPLACPKDYGGGTRL